jgi:lysophospholipase L1-like esterase
MPAAVPVSPASRPGPGTTRRPRRIAGAGHRTPRRGALLLVAAVGLLVLVLLPQAAQAGGASYVALGDSYTSGPFIPDHTGSPAGCLRSTNDYPADVASAVGASSFTNVSCAGAATADMTAPQSVTLGTNPPEFSALSPSTTLVTLGIGGNDIGFVGIVETCAKESLFNPFGSPCRNHYTSGGTDQLAQAIVNLAPKIGSILREIHGLAPSARVFLVGYPAILPNSGDGCWPLVPVSFGDVPYLRGVELKLNQMLASQAAANGATFVNTYTDSIGHDACQLPGTKWMEGLIPTSPAAPFHPNQLGEEHIADQVIAAIG